MNCSNKDGYCILWVNDFLKLYETEEADNKGTSSEPCSTDFIFEYGADLDSYRMNDSGNSNYCIYYHYSPRMEYDLVILDAKKDLYKCWKRLAEIGLIKKCVINLTESGAVDWRCRPMFYRLFRQSFPAFFTYRDDCINNTDVLKTYVVMSRVERVNGSNIAFFDRRLLCMICAKKKSHFPDEMYSVRKKNIDYFEQHHDIEFDLYGPWWGEEYRNWKGIVPNKREVYHSHKFALCIENSREPGYITEKIFDCFRFGIVPIYAGPPNIDDYIPKDCYIDYFSYHSIEEMVDDLGRITESEYNKYLESVNRFILSDQYDKKFYPKNTYENCIYCIRNNKKRLSRMQIMMVGFIDSMLGMFREIITRYLQLRGNH